MTDKLRAAAEKAMQALEDFNHLSSPEHLHIYETITIPETLQALRQALDQLPDTTKMIDTGVDCGAWSDVPDATKWVDELRGDEPEPFGWLFKQADGDLYKLLRGEDAKWHEKNNPSWIKVSPLYTAPPKREWQGLTDDEITEAGKSTVEGKYMLPHSFARAIEAKLKEKNGG